MSAAVSEDSPFFASDSVALVVGAPGGQILAANAAFCQHIGYTEGELLGQPVQVLQNPTVSGSLVAALQEQQAGSGFSVHEVGLRRKTGQLIRATIRASPLYCIESGALQGFSLLLTAIFPLDVSHEAAPCAAVTYASPLIPAASVEGLRNVASSVLRLLQIGGDEMWKPKVDASAMPPPALEPAAAEMTHSGEQHSKGRPEAVSLSPDSDGSDDDCGHGGSPFPPLPVNEVTARAAWSVLCASVLQKSMFSNVLLTRPRGPEELRGKRTPSGRRHHLSDPNHVIWHVTSGLEALLGYSAEDLVGRDISALATAQASEGHEHGEASPIRVHMTPSTSDACLAPAAECAHCDADGAAHANANLLPGLAGAPCAAGADAPMGGSRWAPARNGSHSSTSSEGMGDVPPSSRLKELFEAVAAQRNCLVEIVLPTATGGGAPRFCLAYVLPLACEGPRASSVAVAFLDVHASLPYMQRHMEARGFGDCDLYTFVKFSLLNCLVTDPSARTADPMARNPIVFASAGFGVMCGCAPHEVIHRNCRFMQSPSFVESMAKGGDGMDAIFPQHEAVSHMSASLDARQESLTYLHNFRKDGTPFANLLFMTPILDRSGKGVLFWIGVQHPLGDPPATTGRSGNGASALASSEADILAQLRSCQQALHNVQLQEIYGSYTTMAQRTALMIHSADGNAPTTMCRLCEHHVIADCLPLHEEYCKVVSQCKTLVSCSDTTLARMLVKLNSASNASSIFGAGSTPAALVVDLLRSYATVLLGITASTMAMPILDALPAELDLLVAAAVQPATAALWADIRAAGTRKMAALQHAYSWAGELQHTIVHMPTSDPLSQGQAPCIADFEVVREIQRGSHATVWLVRKKQTKDIFAMKVIDKRSGRLNRLHTERKVLFLCSSPFVVKTFYAFEEPDALYLVMERLQQDCKHVLQTHGAMKEGHALPILCDMVLALEHLHACGIVHRDLKPENMLLTTTGRLKLADFGLSHVTARAATKPEDVAKDPSIVGTPFYMAPETIRGKARGVEPAADWWSFGVIMYEFLLGFPPFQGAKVGEIYRAILSVTFVVPVANCAVTSEAADLVARLLVPDPRRRLTGAATVMSHPWFGAVNWQAHAHSAGEQTLHPSKLLAASSSSAPNALSASLQSLAATGGSLHARTGLGAPGRGMLASVARTASGGSKTSEAGLSLARSITSVGIESERSAASTTLAEMAGELNEAQTWHMDNLMGLNGYGATDAMES